MVLLVPMSLRTFVLLGVVMALFSSDVARAQITPPTGGVKFVVSDPLGVCNAAYLQYNSTNGKLWGCEAGVWTVISGGGGGGGTTIWTGSGDPNGTTSDVAPHNMTTDSSPVPYVASASGEAAPNLAYCAFSSSCLNNVWQSNLNPTYPTWLEMDLGSGNAVILKNYSLQTNSYGAYMPYNFQMQGSNDNSTWTTVDTRSAITFSNNTTQNFVCATQTTPYRYFRVLTSTSPTPAYTIIAQVYLFASNPFTSGAAGDFFYSVSLDQFFGPRTSGATPSWPAQSLPNFSGVISNGSTFTASGCSNSTLVGGATAGSFKSGTTGTCTVVITPGITAPHGWACKASDLTTSADLVTQTATTTSTFTLSGITVSADVVNFSCTGY